jgi:hypothetical protein
LHEEFWHTRLVCPGCCDYVWNDEWQTMEFSVYGHPGEPKRGPANVALTDVVGGNFGLTLAVMGRPVGDIGRARSKFPVLAADWVGRWGRPPSVVWWHEQG